MYLETWWDASREFREWRLQSLGIHSTGAARELSRGNSTPFQYIFTPPSLPAQGCLLCSCWKPQAPFPPLSPSGLEVRHQGGMKMVLVYLPLHTPPSSAQLDSEVRWGLEGRPGQGSTEPTHSKGAPEAMGVGSHPHQGRGALKALELFQPSPTLFCLSVVL